MENITKTAIVTGAGTGIGKVIAYELAKAGYDVAVHCNGSTEGANEVAEKIRNDFGRKAVVIRSNLAELAGVDRLFDEFNKHFERLDLFVNNAGVTKKSKFLETEEELFDLIVNVDYKGAYFCMQRAARLMKEKGIEGSIILISSNNAKAHFADVSVYGSVKAAIQKAAEHMAIELAQYKIRVNTVAPGWTDTGASRLDDKESTYYKVPLKRWAQCDEIAAAILYLSGDMAKSITGTTLVIDGGALLVSDKGERYGYYTPEN
jgi:NAD(P)-dependent dehydrogenase (short-subunit alcohol dehydrogenase family)